LYASADEEIYVARAAEESKNDAASEDEEMNISSDEEGDPDD
jgi:hypothetical protein